MKHKTRRVLVVDDNRDNLILLEAQLQKMGMETILANGASKAIQMAISEQPDLILMDVMMPEMDGFEACKRLKADNRTSSIPIVFVSSRTDTIDKITGLDLGAIDYITNFNNLATTAVFQDRRVASLSNNGAREPHIFIFLHLLKAQPV